MRFAGMTLPGNGAPGDGGRQNGRHRVVDALQRAVRVHRIREIAAAEGLVRHAVEREQVRVAHVALVGAEVEELVAGDRPAQRAADDLAIHRQLLRRRARPK